MVRVLREPSILHGLIQGEWPRRRPFALTLRTLQVLLATLLSSGALTPPPLRLHYQETLPKTMAAMTLAAPMALAGVRTSLKVQPRRSSVALHKTTKASIKSSTRGAMQVRAAIAIGVGEPMAYNDTGKWRENFDLAAWASEVTNLGGAGSVSGVAPHFLF
jgi:hypothetical protein